MSWSDSWICSFGNEDTSAYVEASALAGAGCKFVTREEIDHSRMYEIFPATDPIAAMNGQRLVERGRRLVKDGSGSGHVPAIGPDPRLMIDFVEWDWEDWKRRGRCGCQA